MEVSFSHHCSLQASSVTVNDVLVVDCFWPSQVKQLGDGACGSVFMVELAGTGHCYALKTVDKEDMIRRNKVPTPAWLAVHQIFHAMLGVNLSSRLLHKSATATATLFCTLSFCCFH
eukprot:scaffold445033_cov43-Prasinocladus_malaysianus.AAC.2